MKCSVGDPSLAMLEPDSMKAETASLPGARRSPLDVFASMFRRRARESEVEAATRRGLRGPGPAGPSMTQSSDRIWDLLSTSPVRARNLEQDMEALRRSRTDNPYLQQQMERYSLQDETEGRCDDQQLLFAADDEVDCQDLHKHLVRSPPPQFPHDVAQFVFPGQSSPRGGCSPQGSPQHATAASQ